MTSFLFGFHFLLPPGGCGCVVFFGNTLIKMMTMATIMMMYSRISQGPLPLNHLPTLLSHVLKVLVLLTI
jgi:hypothetical protein